MKQKPTHPEKDWHLVKPAVERNSPGLDAAIARYTRLEKHLYPLRINRTTVIYVTRARCTPAYTEQYRRKLEAQARGAF